MEIITKCDKTLLGAFFDFDKECVVYVDKPNANKETSYILKFNCSDLEIKLKNSELDVLQKLYTIETKKYQKDNNYQKQKPEKNELKISFNDYKNIINVQNLCKTGIVNIANMKGKVILLLQNNNICIKDKEEVKNIYLDIEKGRLVYKNGLAVIYNDSRYKKQINKFIEENNIDTNDFFTQVALNKAVLF